MNVREVIREHKLWGRLEGQDKGGLLSSQLSDHLSEMLIDQLWRYLDLLEAQDTRPMEET